jgi:hypothetical protein
MTLVNGSAGAIVGVGTAGLTIDTGAHTIANAGLIEADHDYLTIVSAVANSGRLYVLSGTLTLERAVSGTGLAYINAGTLIADAALDERVEFVGGAGVLQLAQSQAYSSSVYGFSATGGTSLDLGDIGFVSSGEATFSGTASRGVLTVTDGTHTARISLVGDYLGVSVAAAAPASPQVFAAAMAGLGAAAVASGDAVAQAHDPLLPTLAIAR